MLIQGVEIRFITRRQFDIFRRVHGPRKPWLVREFGEVWVCWEYRDVVLAMRDIRDMLVLFSFLKEREVSHANIR